MDFDKCVDIIFKSIPEFKISCNQSELNKAYFNSFLGDFGLFTRDSILERKALGVRCLQLINEIFNNYYHDEDFRNKIIVNILEVLTDYHITQKSTVYYCDGECLIEFKRLLDSSFTNLLNEFNFE